MHVDVSADPFGVDDDDRSLRPADVGIEDAVCLRDLAVGPEVRAKGIADPTERLRPRLQRVHGVAQDAHDLGLSAGEALDRKSTRLNSSHGSISYAVFCLT